MIIGYVFLVQDSYSLTTSKSELVEENVGAEIFFVDNFSAKVI